MASEPIERVDGYVALSSLCDASRGITYGIVQPGPDTIEGVPILRAGEIENGRISTTNLLRVARNLDASYSRSRIQGGEVLLTLVGAYFGKVAVTDHRHVGMNTARAVGVIPIKVDAWYVAYALMSPMCQAQMRERATTTAQPTLNLGDVANLPIPWPDAKVRKGATEILRSLDKRLDLLRQTNATLEAIAQALFKSWFIDFDPVRAKAEGRELEGMDAATAALFPAEFEESALGVIPKGWSAVPFAQTVNIMGGGTPKTSVAEFWGGDIPWFSVVDAPGAGQVFTLRTEKSISAAGVENSSTRVLPAWTTIISARGTVGKLAMTACPMAMNQSCYGLGPKLSGTEPLVYLAAQRLVDDLKRLAHGGVFDTITRDTLSSVSVVQAAPEVRACFAEMVRPLFEQIQAGVARMASLGELRDILLPRLISGKLRLPEAQQHLEDALA